MNHRNSQTPIVSVGLVLCGLCLGACAAGSGESCGVDSDCSGRLVCSVYTARCANPEDICAHDRDCPTGMCSATEHLCVAPDAGTADTGGAADAGPRGDMPTTDGGTAADAPAGDVLAGDQAGADGGGCAALPACDPLHPVGPTAVRLSVFALGADGQPGSGLDVDGQRDTCAPAGACSGGVDNALQPLGTLANPTLRQRIDDGRTIFLVATPGSPGTTPDCPFTFDLFQAVPESCASGCSVRGDSFVAPCQPATHFAGVRLGGGVAAAGAGEDQRIRFNLTIAGADIAVPLRRAQLQADVAFDEAAGSLRTVDGLLAGAVVIDELLDAIRNSELDDMAQGAAEAIILNYVHPDLDLDGDGTKEAASIGVRIAGSEVVTVSGVAP